MESYVKSWIRPKIKQENDDIKLIMMLILMKLIEREREKGVHFFIISLLLVIGIGWIILKPTQGIIIIRIIIYYNRYIMMGNKLRDSTRQIKLKGDVSK